MARKEVDLLKMALKQADKNYLDLKNAFDDRIAAAIKAERERIVDLYTRHRENISPANLREIMLETNKD